MQLDTSVKHEDSDIDGPHSSISWYVLLCGGMSNMYHGRLSELRKPSNYGYGKLSYSLKNEFKFLQNRDVASDLRLLKHHIQIEEENSSKGFSILSCEGSDSQNEDFVDEVIKISNKSVLEISVCKIPNLKRSSWKEWDDLVKDLVTPYDSALDILTGKMKEGDTMYKEKIDLELFIFLHNILPSNMRGTARKVKEKEGLKGSALYQAIKIEMNKSYQERLMESRIANINPLVPTTAVSAIISLLWPSAVIKIVAVLALSTMVSTNYESLKSLCQKVEKVMTVLLTLTSVMISVACAFVMHKVVKVVVVMQKQLEHIMSASPNLEVGDGPTSDSESEGLMGAMYKHFEGFIEKYFS